MRSEKRILVVEDDALTAGAVKMVLEWEGYRVDCAANGQEALNLMPRWRRRSNRHAPPSPR